MCTWWNSIKALLTFGDAFEIDEKGSLNKLLAAFRRMSFTGHSDRVIHQSSNHSKFASGKEQ
ncbi:hypothetical protein EYF80_013783 [Liparis tanakae]|uniref:Uncharacterized protein n=1 Tax=Liparis tanakae TaxID=230148 RepID=A0A4Z2IDH5_9TELE|nr:hypothetical protein EYF80_013783 [Liparis tanakae]